MNLKPFLLLFLALGVFSCKVPPYPEPEVPRPSVRAGVYDSTFVYEELNPPVGIPLAWNFNNLYATGAVFLDVDQDGEGDFLLSINRANPDSSLKIGTQPDPSPNVGIQPFGDWQIVVTQITTSSGSGGNPTYEFAVAKYEYYGLINDINNEWGIDTYQTMWRFGPASVDYGPGWGPWASGSGEEYIGFGRGEFDDDLKYGWIKIDNSDPLNPQIVSVAYQP